MNNLSTKDKIELAAEYMAQALSYGTEAIEEVKSKLGIDEFESDWFNDYELTGAIFVCEPQVWEKTLIKALEEAENNHDN